ncbi:MAG: replication initiation protein RepM [Bacteriovoracia bacterium]
MNKSGLVVKSNELIRASYSLGLVEQRLILMAIVTARETTHGITADTLLEIRAMDYAQLFNVTKQAAYMALTDAVETLFNRRATVQVYDEQRNSLRPLTVRWVTAMHHEENTGLITLRFGHEVVPEITRLEANFTSYELRQISGLRSAYAVRLYELLIQWKASGITPLLKLDEFRSQLGLLKHEYSQMCHFKKYALDLAVSQINEHTDIIVDYKQHKAGRVITGFMFTFTHKKQPKDVTPKPKKATPKPTEDLNTLLNDKKFLEKHARAGESWDDVRSRLKAEAETGKFSLAPTN